MQYGSSSIHQRSSALPQHILEKSRTRAKHGSEARDAYGTGYRGHKNHVCGFSMASILALLKQPTSFQKVLVYPFDLDHEPYYQFRPFVDAVAIIGLS